MHPARLAHKTGIRASSAIYPLAPVSLAILFVQAATLLTLLLLIRP